MRLRQVAFLAAFGPVVLAQLLGCKGHAQALRRNAPKLYSFSGTIYDENGQAEVCILTCYTTTEILKRIQADLRTGSYNFNLTSDEAQTLHQIHIINGLGDTTTFDFDRHMLRDSIINLDFKLVTIPRNYFVIASSTPHVPSFEKFDTIWLDLDNTRVSKAVSDSLWRGIPHK